MRLIDADAMLDDVLRQNELIKALGIEELTKMSLTICDGIKQEICNQPTIDAVEVKHGEWIEVHDWLQIPQEDSGTYRCSACGQVMKYPWKYCPNCGAKMDGEVKHE